MKTILKIAKVSESNKGHSEHKVHYFIDPDFQLYSEITSRLKSIQSLRDSN